MTSPHVDGAAQYSTTEYLAQRVTIHDRFSTNPYGWHRWVFDQILDIGISGPVLDVGAGTGELWFRNQDRMPSDVSLTLADASAAMVAELDRRGGRTGLRARMQIIDVQQLDPVPRYELIVCNHVLYHVPDRGEAVRRLAAALRHGGRLVAATNGARHLAELDELTTRHVPDVDMGAYAASTTAC